MKKANVINLMAFMAFVLIVVFNYLVFGIKIEVGGDYTVLKWFRDLGLNVTSNLLSSILSFIGVVTILKNYAGLDLFDDEEIRVKKIIASIMEDLNKQNSSLQNFQKYGIEAVSLDYNELNWKELLSDCKELEVFASFAKTWLSINHLKITGGKNTKITINVILPDYNDVELVSALAARFDLEKEVLTKRMRESVEEWKKAFDAHSNVTLNIYLTKVQPVYTYYRMGKRTIVTLYNHKQEKGAVPCFTIRGESELFTFFKEDFAKAKAKSTHLPLGEIKSGRVDKIRVPPPSQSDASIDREGENES